MTKKREFFLYLKKIFAVPFKYFCMPDDLMQYFQKRINAGDGYDCTLLHIRILDNKTLSFDYIMNSKKTRFFSVKINITEQLCNDVDSFIYMLNMILKYEIDFKIQPFIALSYQKKEKLGVFTKITSGYRWKS